MKHPLLALPLCVVLALPVSPPAMAQAMREVSLEALFAQLAEADESNWQALEKAIQARWATSGSASMDLLLERARRALDDDPEAAIDHLGALTDHAPNFTEGWHMRATAFFRAGRFGLALADLRRVLALEPRHFDALEGVAVIMETLDEPERALDMYHQVLAIHPRNADVKEAVARLERQLGATL